MPVDKCVICLEELTTNIGAAAPCGHCFHQHCFEALKQSEVNAQCDSDDEEDVKRKVMPHCPLCKKKIKRFHSLHLSFEPQHQAGGSAGRRRRARSCSTCSIPSLAPSSSNSDCEGESTSEELHNDEIDDEIDDENSITEEESAIQCLSSENTKLRSKLHDLKRLSNDQSELLLQVLPRHDDLEAKVTQSISDMYTTQMELKTMEAENIQLISERNDIEIKMEVLQTEKMELVTTVNGYKERERTMKEYWTKKLEKSKLKRKKLKMTMKQDIVQQREGYMEQVNELQERVEENEEDKKKLTSLVLKSRMKVDDLKVQVQQLKRLTRMTPTIATTKVTTTALTKNKKKKKKMAKKSSKSFKFPKYAKTIGNLVKEE